MCLFYVYIFIYIKYVSLMVKPSATDTIIGVQISYTLARRINLDIL